MSELPHPRRSFEASSTWINLLVAAVGAIAALPLVQSLLTAGSELEANSLGRAIVEAMGLFVVGWIITSFIHAVGCRAAAVESAYYKAVAEWEKRQAENVPPPR